nr:anaphase-promoting complex subunit 5 isoform X1 [Tanacetum cinerariifolium]
LYHGDYPSALENLLHYFDYSAWMEGSNFVPTSVDCITFGRYEIALLSLGMAHFYFGHPKLALEVLTEVVCVSQQHSGDTYLAYTLTAICNMLSTVGISNMTVITGASDPHMSSIGTSLLVQQQLFVLLQISFKRADSLKLKRLVASNHLAITKFDLTRPLLSFGPKALIQLKTNPTSVCKQLRASSQLLYQFDNENIVMTIDGALKLPILKITEAKFLSVLKSRILLVKLQLLHECALYMGHLKLAQQICDELGVLASSVTGVDMEIKTKASLHYARTLLATNQFIRVRRSNGSDELYKESSCQHGLNIVDTPPTESSHTIWIFHIRIGALCDRLLDYDEIIRQKVVAVLSDQACHELSFILLGTIKFVADGLYDASSFNVLQRFRKACAELAAGAFPPCGSAIILVSCYLRLFLLVVADNNKIDVEKNAFFEAHYKKFDGLKIGFNQAA